MLVDSSAWIDFLRGASSATVRRLTRAIQSQEPLATTTIVMLEVLAGARNSQEEQMLSALFGGCELIKQEEPLDAEVAAGLYRACRREGVTIRRTTDCLIAAVAIRTRTAVLHNDADFEALARHTDLATVET